MAARTVAALITKLERYFAFQQLETNWRTEILAGFTTFITMAYIVFVNPSILADAGLPFQATLAATCIASGLGSCLMGAFARYPIALAPGMGLNAFFTYAVVKGMGIDWRIALGAVFLSGVIFLALTVLGIQRLIVKAIPAELYAAVAVGIGLFIAFIGLKNSGIVVPDKNTFVALGNLRSPQTALALFGLILTAALNAWGVKASMLIGIVTTTVTGALAGLVPWQPQWYSLADLSATAFQLNVNGALALGLAEIVFVFLFVDIFDNIGTLVAVGKKARLIPPGGEIPRLNRILLTDATATVAGSLAGTSTVLSYIESASGVAAGGRSGVTSVVVGLLFFAALFIAPLLGAIPAAATAPALIIVGSLMIGHAREIDWDDTVLALPAFLTIVAIPLTFSIANGLAFGFITYTLLKVLRGRGGEINWLVYVLTALFMLRFFYLGRG